MKKSPRAKRPTREARHERTTIVMPYRPLYVVDPYYRVPASSSAPAAPAPKTSAPEPAPAEPKTPPDTPADSDKGEESGADDVDPLTGKKREKTKQKRVRRSRTKKYLRSNK
eukprot:jgi/Mesvir1/23343/Mv21038-RA.1